MTLGEGATEEDEQLGHVADGQRGRRARAECAVERPRAEGHRDGNVGNKQGDNEPSKLRDG